MKRLATLLVGAILATTTPALAELPGPATTPQVYGPNQRYVIVFSPHVVRGTFLLDTQTGRVWQLTQYVDTRSEPFVWELMERASSVAEEAAIMNKYGAKTAPPAKP